MSRSLRIHQLKEILPFTILWFLGGALYMLIEKGVLGDAKAYPSTGNPYDFESAVVTVLIATFIAGTLQGLAEVTIFKKAFARFSFGVKLFFKTLLYALIITGVLLGLSFPLNSQALGKPVFHPEVVDTIKNFVSNMVFWTIILYMAFLILIALFIAELMRNLGNNVVINFFTGRYHSSKVEQRIFMFLDMKSSTTIAEQLGHQKYYKLLNSYYEDMTRPILETHGEIYQYVGDEIVVSWKYERGIKQNNCLECFFGIKQEIASRAADYNQRFGVVPEFKAGFHAGSVTTGEVGVVKKELLFTGDAINTTARIQGLCNELKSDLLVSKDLIEALDLDKSYVLEQRGEHALRGRDRTIELLSVQKS